MLRHAARICCEPGCAQRATHGSRCQDHARQVQQRVDRARPNASERGYDAAWAKERAEYLAAFPLCVGVLVREGGRYVRRHAEGCNRQATVVDHVVPRRHGGSNTWANYQPLSAPCHGLKTARYDGGFGNGRGAKAVG